MAIKIGINGGRIGRTYFALGCDPALQTSKWWASMADRWQTLTQLADSVMGRASEDIKAGENSLIVDGRKSPAIATRRKSWPSSGGQYVLEMHQPVHHA